MLLQDEFLKRNKLKPASIKYCSNSCLFLADCGPVGRLIRIRWQEKPPAFSQLPSNGPGVFVFESKLPQKSIREELLRTEVQECLYWDEYAPYLIKWSGKIDADKVVSDPDLALVFGWQMFVFVHENALLACNFHDVLYNSLDTQKPVLERYQAVQECLSEMEYELPHQRYMWNASFGFYLKNYAYWLAELILSSNKLLLLESSN